MGTELPQEGARTLAGLVFTHLGRRPVVGDELVAAGVELRVAEVDRARITRLRIVLPQASARRAPRADPPA
jgi:CBS domain containing-hemolysin-like protein